MSPAGSRMACWLLLSKEVLELSVTGKSPEPSPDDFNMESVSDAPCTVLALGDNSN